MAQDAGDINVTVEPANGLDVVENGEATFDVVVENATNEGIGAYEFNVSISDTPAVEAVPGSIEIVEGPTSDTNPSGPFDNSTVSGPSNNLVEFEVALGDYDFNASDTAQEQTVATFNVTATGNIGATDAVTAEAGPGGASQSVAVAGGFQNVGAPSAPGDFYSATFEGTDATVVEEQILGLVVPDQKTASLGEENVSFDVAVDFSKINEGLTSADVTVNVSSADQNLASIAPQPSTETDWNPILFGQGAALADYRLQPDGNSLQMVGFYDSPDVKAPGDISPVDEYVVFSFPVNATSDPANLGESATLDLTFLDATNETNSQYSVGSTGQSELVIGDVNVDFNDQETFSDNPSVNVENVDSDGVQDAAVLLTYTNQSTGDVILAGATSTSSGYDNETVSVDIEDTGGFPSDFGDNETTAQYTAHLAPNPSDVLSSASANALANGNFGAALSSQTVNNVTSAFGGANQESATITATTFPDLAGSPTVNFPSDPTEVLLGNPVPVDVDTDGIVQELQNNNDVQNNNVSVLLTFTNQTSGNVITAGAETLTQDTDGTVDITLEDDSAFQPNLSQDGEATALHTAHIVPSQLASDQSTNISSPVSTATVDGITQQGDQDTANVTVSDFPAVNELSVDIRSGTAGGAGLVVGSEHPWNFYNIDQGSVFTPVLFDETDTVDNVTNIENSIRNHYTPVLEGQHTGVVGVPAAEANFDAGVDEYRWAAEESADLAAENEPLLGFETAEQTVTVSYAPGVQADDTVRLDYSDAADHGLEIANVTVETNLQTQFIINNPPAADELQITFPEAPVTDDGNSPTFVFNLEWAAEDPINGLSVDEPANIDLNTDHVALQDGAGQASDNFVTFETGKTAIGPNDAQPLQEGDGPNSWSARNTTSSNPDDPSLAVGTEAPEDGQANPGSFRVWQDQYVTFETANNGEQVRLFEVESTPRTQDEEDLIFSLGDQVAELGTAPGNVINLDTSTLAEGKYFVTFGGSETRAAVIQVIDLDLEATAPADATQSDQAVTIQTSANDTTGNDLEVWFREAGDDGLEDVVHVAEDELDGQGTASTSVVPNVDLDPDSPQGTYEAIVQHNESGVTAVTDTFEVEDDVGQVNIESPDLTAPGTPGVFTRGDIIPIELEFVDTDIGTVTFTDEFAEEPAAQFDIDVTVRDGDGDGSGTLYLNTYQVGHGLVEEADGDLRANVPEYRLSTLGMSDQFDIDDYDNRNHGFFTNPSEGGITIEGTVTADGENGIDIIGGSQGGAVLSAGERTQDGDIPGFRYNIESVAGEIESREVDQGPDSVNQIDIEQRSTDSFIPWTAPGNGEADFGEAYLENESLQVDDRASMQAIQAALEDDVLTQLPTEETTVTRGTEELINELLGPDVINIIEDVIGIDIGETLDLDSLDPTIVNLVQDLLGLDLEENRTEYVDMTSVAEDDYFVLQVQTDGIDGVLHETLLRAADESNYPSVDIDEDLNVPETTEFSYFNGTVSEGNYGVDIYDAFTAAQQAEVRRGFDADTGALVTESLLNYDIGFSETLGSIADREAGVIPDRENIADPGIDPDDVDPVVLDLLGEEEAVIANSDAQGNLDELFIPYKLDATDDTDGDGDLSDEDNPLVEDGSPDGQFQGGIAFNTVHVLEPGGGDQPHGAGTTTGGIDQPPVTLAEDPLIDSIGQNLNPRLDADSTGIETKNDLGYATPLVLVDELQEVERIFDPSVTDPRATDPSPVQGEMRVHSLDSIQPLNITGTSTLAPGTPLRVDFVSREGEDTPFVFRNPEPDQAAVDTEIRGDAEWDPEGVYNTSGGELLETATWGVQEDFSETRDGVEIQDGTQFDVIIERANGDIRRGQTQPEVRLTTFEQKIPGIVMPDPVVEDFVVDEDATTRDVLLVNVFDGNQDAVLQVVNENGQMVGESEVLSHVGANEGVAIALDTENVTNALTVNAISVEGIQDVPFQGDDASQTVALGEEAALELDNIQPADAEVVTGATISSISADATNIGDESGEFDVELTVDGNQIATDTVSLDGGETQTVSFDDVDTSALDPGDYTHAIEEVDGQASTSGSLTILAEQSTFELSNLAPQDATATVGDSLTVSADVENTGTIEGTQTLELDIGDGAVTMSEELTLGAGDSDTVEFEVDTSGIPAGDYTHEISSDDDSVSSSLTLEEATSTFELSNLSPANGTATVNDTVTVSADVENTGSAEGTQTIELDIGGGAVTQSQELTLGAGESGSVEFDVDTSGIDAGDYTHVVSSDDSEVEGSLTLEEGGDEGGDEDGSGAGFGVAIAALAMLGAALLAIRRQTE
jgi:PGF-CTERM protein